MFIMILVIIITSRFWWISPFTPRMETYTVHFLITGNVSLHECKTEIKNTINEKPSVRVSHASNWRN